MIIMMRASFTGRGGFCVKNIISTLVAKDAMHIPTFSVKTLKVTNKS